MLAAANSRMHAFPLFDLLRTQSSTPPPLLHAHVHNCPSHHLPLSTLHSQDLPKLETAARSALPRLSALAAKAKAWRLVAAAETAAEAAAAGEEARKGMVGLGLEQHQAAANAVRSCMCAVAVGLRTGRVNVAGAECKAKGVHGVELVNVWDGMGGRLCCICLYGSLRSSPPAGQTLCC